MENLYSPQGAVEWLAERGKKVGRRQVIRACAEGEIRAFRLRGGKQPWLIPESALEEYMEASCRDTGNN